MRSGVREFDNLSEYDFYQFALFFEEFWTSGVPEPYGNGLYVGDGRELEILRVELVSGRLRVALRAGPLREE